MTYKISNNIIIIFRVEIYEKRENRKIFNLYE